MLAARAPARRFGLDHRSAGGTHARMPSDPQLVARDLRRSFRLPTRTIDVLRGITFEIAHGETVFLCGASGAGKTTLLYTLAGLETPESGSVHFQGMDVYRASDNARARLRNERFGFIFQGYFLFP